MSAAFIGMCDFVAWNISHEFIIAIMKESRSSCNKNGEMIQRKICKTFVNIQNNFPAINAFIVLERKHDELVDAIKQGGEET